MFSTNDAVALPSRGAASTHEPAADVDQSDVSTVAAPSQTQSAQETPATSQAPSEADPSTAATSSVPADASKPTTPQSQAKRDSKPAVPIIPAVPVIATAKPKTASYETAPSPGAPADQFITAADAAAPQAAEAEPAEPAAPAPKAAPKSWADLVRSKNAAAAAASAAVNGAGLANGAAPSRASTLAEALKQFNVGSDEKIAFLEPRGLVNTGNMCYMNSVCFYALLSPRSCLTCAGSSNTCILYAFLHFSGSGQQEGSSFFQERHSPC